MNGAIEYSKPFTRITAVHPSTPLRANGVCPVRVKCLPVRAALVDLRTELRIGRGRHSYPSVVHPLTEPVLSLSKCSGRTVSTEGSSKSVDGISRCRLDSFAELRFLSFRAQRRTGFADFVKDAESRIARTLDSSSLHSSE